MSLLTRKRTILAKVEVTYGTDVVPVGATNAISVRNMTLTPLAAETVSRDLIRPFLGASETLIATKYVQINFEVEVAGSGTAGTAPKYGPLLRGCGLSETVSAGVSVIYAPVSASMDAVTIYYNVDGVLHKITGCRGNMEITIGAKAIPVMKFTFTGLYNAPLDAALPVVDYTGFKTPLAANTSNTTGFSLFSYSGILESLSLNLGNEVTYRTLIGSESVIITNRAVSGTAVFEAPTITTKDFFAASIATTLGALAITHGTVTGNKMSIASSTIDLGQPSYSDSDGVQMLTMPFVAVPSTTGNDEITFTVL